MVSSATARAHALSDDPVRAVHGRVPAARPARHAPVVEQAMKACRETTSADDVRRIIADARQKLRDFAAEARLPSTGRRPAPPFRRGVHRRRRDRAGERGHAPHPLRTEKPVRDVGARADTAATDDNAVTGVHVRVPIPSADGLRSLQMWATMIESQLDPMAPRLTVWPRAGTWLDIVADNHRGPTSSACGPRPRRCPARATCPTRWTRTSGPPRRMCLRTWPRARAAPIDLHRDRRPGEAEGEARRAAATAVANVVLPEGHTKHHWLLLLGGVVALIAIVAIIMALVKSKDDGIPKPPPGLSRRASSRRPPSRRPGPWPHRPRPGRRSRRRWRRKAHLR